jgi:hypothetical protein
VDNNFQVGRGGPPNPRFANQGDGYKRGYDDIEGVLNQREVDLRSKLRRDQEFRKGGGSGPSHYFNCNRDDHFRASCPNPPFCYNCKKDGHKSMACPTKKGVNLKICGHGMPG